MVFRDKWATNKKKMREIEVGNKLMEWLNKYKINPYNEVVTRHGITDSVFINNHDQYIGIEAKTSLSMAVISQAYHNKDIYNYSVIITKSNDNSKIRKFTKTVLEDYGIGLIEVKLWKGDLTPIAFVDSDNMVDSTAVYSVLPKYNEIDKEYIKSKLFEEQKETIAGSESGTVSTEFKRSMVKLDKYLKENHPCSIEDLYNNVEHHYSSVRSLYDGMRRYSKHAYSKNKLWHYSEKELEKNISRWT